MGRCKGFRQPKGCFYAKPCPYALVDKYGYCRYHKRDILAPPEKPDPMHIDEGSSTPLY